MVVISGRRAGNARASASILNAQLHGMAWRGEAHCTTKWLELYTYGERESELENKIKKASSRAITAGNHDSSSR